MKNIYIVRLLFSVRYRRNFLFFDWAVEETGRQGVGWYLANDSGEAVEMCKSRKLIPESLLSNEEGLYSLIDTYGFGFPREYGDRILHVSGHFAVELVENENIHVIASRLSAADFLDFCREHGYCCIKDV